MNVFVLLFTCSTFFACNPEVEFLSEAELERRDFLSGLNCCDCLAMQFQEVPHPDLVCPHLNISVEKSDRLFHQTPCLCSLADSPFKERSQYCQERLLAGESIQIIGRCIEDHGVCEAACNLQTFVFLLQESE